MRFYTEKDREQWLGVRQRTKPSRSNAPSLDRVVIDPSNANAALDLRVGNMAEQRELAHILQLRQSYGDHHSVAEAPGHLFLEHEAEDLASFLQLAMLNGWDGYVLTQADYVRMAIW